jgi:uncharacterized DUF497 family protein
MRFEWDPRKAASNLAKHGVAFEETATVFDDPLFITLLDEEHSAVEERYITVGVSDQGQILLVAHADREGAVRIISARRATKNEVRFYAEPE